jgi:hypothetical protein
MRSAFQGTGARAISLLAAGEDQYGGNVAQQEPGHAGAPQPGSFGYVPVSRQNRLRQTIRHFTIRARSTFTAVRTCSGAALPGLMRLSCCRLRRERGGV